jgi:hypothetical protein
MAAKIGMEIVKIQRVTGISEQQRAGGRSPAR